MNLEKLSLEELYQYEHLAKTVCSIYENSVRNYDGSIRESSDDVKKFDKFNACYRMIIKEVENRLEKL